MTNGLDNGKILDYPAFKLRYPQKTASEWLAYREKATYKESIQLLKELKSKLTPEEYQAALDELKDF